MRIIQTGPSEACITVCLLVRYHCESVPIPKLFKVYFLWITYYYYNKLYESTLYLNIHRMCVLYFKTTYVYLQRCYIGSSSRKHVMGNLCSFWAIKYFWFCTWRGLVFFSWAATTGAGMNVPINYKMLLFSLNVP